MTYIHQPETYQTAILGPSRTLQVQIFRLGVCRHLSRSLSVIVSRLQIRARWIIARVFLMLIETRLRLPRAERYLTASSEPEHSDQSLELSRDVKEQFTQTHRGFNTQSLFRKASVLHLHSIRPHATPSSRRPSHSETSLKTQLHCPSPSPGPPETGVAQRETEGEGETVRQTEEVERVVCKTTNKHLPHDNYKQQNNNRNKAVRPVQSRKH